MVSPKRTVGLIVVASSVVFSPAVTSQAVGPSTVRVVADNSKKIKQRSELSNVDKEIEAAAKRLVHEHLHELKTVLEHLRAEYPQQYRRAIADLARSSRKLETARNRDERLFELEVETLKAQTSLDLLTAKLKVRDNEADRKQLRRTVERLQRAQIARVRYDVDALQTRLKRTQQQLKNAQQRLQAKQDGLEDQFEKAYVQVLRKAGRQPLDVSDSPSINRPPRKASAAANSQKPDSTNARKRVEKTKD